jgi:hypothetical protein
MLRQTILALAGLTVIVAAKQCTNISAPAEFNARQGLFNVPEIMTNEDVTIFFQNVSIPSLWPHADGGTPGLSRRIYIGIEVLRYDDSLISQYKLTTFSLPLLLP